MCKLTIETRNLNYQYGHFKALNNISLSVPKGAIYGFLGPNGAGKSTTIKTLLGLYTSKENSISIFEKHFKAHREFILSKTGALIESPSLYYNLSARDNLRVICTLRQLNPSNIDTLLKDVGLQDTLSKKVKAFSTGMKQRLGLAIAMIGNPELLILDEPTNGLDPQGMKEFRDILTHLNQKKGVTIFISSHILHEVEKLATHVGIINNGTLLFQGTVQELKNLNVSQTRIQTSDNKISVNILSDAGYSATLTDEQTLSVEIANREDAANIAKLLVQNKLGIYELTTSGKNLEELFFSMMQGDVK